MLHRLYVNNFRCLENFDFTIKGISSLLLIGKNASGKSTIATALEVLQSIGRGINKVNQLVQDSDFSQRRSNIPIRLEIEGEHLIVAALTLNRWRPILGEGL